MSDQDSFRETFINEAQDLTESLELDLVELEDHRHDPELINRIFRAAHTMKSSAAMFGFSQIASLTHSMEGVLDCVRDGVLAIDAEIVSLLLDSLDVLRRMVNEATEGTESDHTTVLAPLCVRLQAVASGEEKSSTASGAHTVEPVEEHIYHIHIALHPNVFCQGTNPLLLLDELSTLGEMTDVRCDLSRLPKLDELDPVQLHLAWDLVLHSSRPREEIDDVFLFHWEDGDIRIEPQSRDQSITRGAEQTEPCTFVPAAHTEPLAAPVKKPLTWTRMAHPELHWQRASGVTQASQRMEKWRHTWNCPR